MTLRVTVTRGPDRGYTARLCDGEGSVIAYEMGSAPQTRAWAAGAEFGLALDGFAIGTCNPYVKRYRSYAAMPMGARACSNCWNEGFDVAQRAKREHTRP